MIKEKHGDITQHLDFHTVVIQGNNLNRAWGSGVALALRPHLPVTYQMDQHQSYGDVVRLGTIAYAVEASGLIGVCCYTQYYWGTASEHNFDEVAFESCLAQVSRTFPEASIAMPRIGTGHGGSSWTKVRRLVEIYLGHLDVTVYHQ